MSITIREMTNDEFEAFCQWSIENHAKELMEQLHISQEEAIKETIEEVAGMLPDGLHTQHNYLMTVVADGNVAARGLYQKCGYEVPRQEGYGKYMIKQLL